MSQEAAVKSGMHILGLSVMPQPPLEISHHTAHAVLAAPRPFTCALGHPRFLTCVCLPREDALLQANQRLVDQRTESPILINSILAGSDPCLDARGGDGTDHPVSTASPMYTE